MSLSGRDRGPWPFALLLATSVLFFEALRSFLATAYFMTVSTLGLNASVAWLLLLLAPIAYPLGLRRAPPGKLLFGLTIGFLALRTAMLVPQPVDSYLPLGGLASATYLLLLPPVFSLLWREPGGPYGAGAAMSIAVVLDLALRIAGLTTDPSASAPGAAIVLPLAAVAGIAVIRMRDSWSGTDRPDLLPPRRRRVAATLALGVGLGLWLALQAIALAQPALVARWTAQDYGILLVAVLLGAVVGSMWLVRNPGRVLEPRVSVPLALLPLLFLADLAYGPTFLSPLIAFLASLAAVVLLARLFGFASEASLTLGAVGGALALASLVFLLTVFLFVFTLTYAHVPGRSLWEGREGTILVGLGFLLFFATAAASGKTPPRETASVGPRRVAAFAVVIALGLSSVGLAVHSVSPVSAPAPVLTAMTYNIHQAFGADGRLDVERIGRVIAFANPDIVALQESDTVRLTSGGVDSVRWLARTLGYHEAYGPPSSEQTYGVAVLSRFPIDSWRYVLLPSVDDQRVLVEVHVTVRGKPLVVFAVHIGLDRDERQLQAGAVLNVTASVSGAALLMGDFNSCPPGTCPEYGPVTDTVYALLRTRWNDSWVDAGNPENDPLGFTFDSLAPFERIDYIFTRGAVATQSCSVVGPPAPVEASDHRGVVATFLLP